MSKRKLVFQKNNNKCVKCGATENLTIDHILPLSEGGTNHFNNLQTLCSVCNYNKGNISKMPFFRHIRKIWGIHGYCQTWKNEMKAIAAGSAGLINSLEQRVVALIQTTTDKKKNELLVIIRFQELKIKALENYLKVEFIPEKTIPSVIIPSKTEPAHFKKIKKLPPSASSPE